MLGFPSVGFERQEVTTVPVKDVDHRMRVTDGFVCSLSPSVASCGGGGSWALAAAGEKGQRADVSSGHSRCGSEWRL